jgi:hypothetical protein
MAKLDIHYLGMGGACHFAVVRFCTIGLATRREDTLQRNDERYGQVRLLNIYRYVVPYRARDEWGHGLV